MDLNQFLTPGGGVEWLGSYIGKEYASKLRLILCSLHEAHPLSPLLYMSGLLPYVDIFYVRIEGLA